MEAVLEKLPLGLVPAAPPSEHGAPHEAPLPARLSTESALGAYAPILCLLASPLQSNSATVHYLLWAFPQLFL